MTKRRSLIVAACLLAHAARGESLGGIVERAVAAAGGKARLAAVRSERMTGTISFGTDLPVPFSLELKRPGKIRVDIAFQKGPFIQAFDGKTGRVLNPFAEPPASQMGPAETRDIAESADMDGPLVDWKARGIVLELLGREDVEGKPAWKLRVRRKSGNVRTLFLDVVSYLKVKWDGAIGEAGKQVVHETLFDDYRAVDGIPFPFRLRSHASGGGQAQEIVLEKIELNPVIEDERFGVPGS
jgi:hypothetical protein